MSGKLPDMVEGVGLTAKQLKFVELLMASPDFDMGRSAEGAGYANPSQSASTLMKHPGVRTAIARAMQERARATKVTAERVIEELAAVAFFNPKDLLGPDGNMVPLKDLPDSVARAVKSFEAKRGAKVRDETGMVTGREPDTYEYMAWDKLKALEMLAKHVGILKDLGVSVNIGSLQINWDEMARPRKGIQEVQDPLEVEIMKAALALPAPGDETNKETP